MEKYDVLIVGAGVAGLNCALHLDKNLKVLIICKGMPEKSDSYLAQGGICRLVDDADFNGYFLDTMRAGHGENDIEAVKCMIDSSQSVIDELISYGVQFARNPDGTLATTREGGHSRPRICFHEDCTGKEITTSLMERTTTLQNVEIRPETTMLDIISDGECYGVVARDNNSGKISRIFADYTVLASGGIGGIYENSTNFRLLTGDGVAICLKRGVRVQNVNYVQIHPTTLYSEKPGRRFLISESVRGEGAVLLDKNFKRFCDELQPRDIVTACIRAQMEKDATPFVWLDMRPVPQEELRAHFPTIILKCREEGYDVFKECIPVVPAQHYFMGGVKSGLWGETSMPRLYAVGETCCNGVHGANRLASNSLLESLLFARRAAQKINSEFTQSDKKLARKALEKLDFSQYSDPEKLAGQYKDILINAIKEADDAKSRNVRS